MTDDEKYGLLLYKHLQGTLTGEEKEKLEQWIDASPEHLALFEELTSEERLSDAIKDYHPDNRLALESRILDSIKTRVPLMSPVIPLFKRPLFRVAAAACLIFILGLGSYLIFSNKTSNVEPIVKTDEPKDLKAPETNRAMITLTNGQRVYLDSVANGQLAVQGNVKLVKLANGQIAYETVTGEVQKEIQYNTLTNPRGSKVIDMALADGSHVWLNAGSSVTFPIAFVGDERKVSITGEAYFEVTHDKSKPFFVTKGDMQVQVLGTHFNVNAYDDEASLKVTLLEGSVKVSRGNSNELLKPGQQSQLNIDGQLSLIKEVNIDEIMAWKDGIFHFESADLKSILRQFSRWYDVEVIYDGPVKNRKFFAIVKRSSTLKGVLELLRDNDIVYRIEGKKLIVRSG